VVYNLSEVIKDISVACRHHGSSFSYFKVVGYEGYRFGWNDAKWRPLRGSR